VCVCATLIVCNKPKSLHLSRCIEMLLQKNVIFSKRKYFFLFPENCQFVKTRIIIYIPPVQPKVVGHD
jgi:hypothetical protein